jgi:ParB family transcriptional regulator, chromosome partitioning protein
MNTATGTAPNKVRLIPIDKIDVCNPRERNRQAFAEITSNIRAVGLKKPVTVTPRLDAEGNERFLLICGEGRMTALRLLGETVVPALVRDVTDQDALIMSLAENIARRKFQPLEVLAGIEQLRAQGYNKRAIAQQTGLSPDYVSGILLLIANGEERLMVAVAKGRIPLSAALTIGGAADDDATIQQALQDAYESGALKGTKLIEARKLVELRSRNGPRHVRGRKHKGTKVTTSSLLSTYRKEVERRSQMVRKTEMTQTRLLFVVGALRSLVADEHFATLLRAEGLNTVPKYLNERIYDTGHPS